MCVKKWIPVFLVLTLSVCLGGMALGASPEMTISVSAPAGAQPGDTITVELRSVGCPGMNAAQFTLGFDTSVLDCTACETGPALSGMMAAANPDAASGAIIAAAGATTVDGNGVLGVFTFTVLREGEYGFTLSDTLFARADGTTISYAVEGAQEIVPEEPEETPEPPEGPEEQPEETPEQPDEAPEIPERPGDEPEEQPGSEAEPVFADCVGHWAQSYIEQAKALGLIDGVGDGKYAPDAGMTRAHYVTILWRAAGEPEPTGPSTFVDMTDSSVYYYKAVAWAEENKVINGVGGWQFSPDTYVTREQLATILYRYHGGVPGEEQIWYGIYDSAFTDSASVSDWAREAVYWAVYHETWCGVGATATGTALYPVQAADRAQIAVIMTRYMANISEGGTLA